MRSKVTLLRLVYLVTWAVMTLNFASCKDEAQLNAAAARQARETFNDINQNEIDSYPLFPECDELANSFSCFQNRLQELVATQLKLCNTQIRLTARDSVLAHITVTHLGQIRYDSISYKGGRPAHLRTIDSLLQQRLVHLPTIGSALKRDIPVSSSYRLPILFTPARVPD